MEPSAGGEKEVIYQDLAEWVMERVCVYLEDLGGRDGLDKIWSLVQASSQHHTAICYHSA